MGINLVHSSSYNPRSMGLAERSVRSVKGLLKKNSRLSQLELDEFMFTVNTNQQGINQGSSLERFLGRAVNTAIPNSLAKSFGFEAAIKERGGTWEHCSQKISGIAEIFVYDLCINGQILLRI